MIKSEKNNDSNNSTHICNFNYLNDAMGGKKDLIKEIIDIFLQQVPKELQSINDAIANKNYPVIKSFAHTMKSSVSIMGISVLTPILREMEALASNADNGSTATTSIEKIKELYQKLNLICNEAIEEIEKEKSKYI